MTRDEALAEAHEALFKAFVLNTFAPLDEADHAVRNALAKVNAIERLIERGRI